MLGGLFVSLGSRLGLRTITRSAIRGSAPRLASSWRLPSGKLVSGALRGGGQALKGAAPFAMGGAMLYSANALRHWADTNVAQTDQISDDQEDYRDWQDDRDEFQAERDDLDWGRELQMFEMEQDARDLEYQRSLYQTALIEGFDQQDRNFQAQMQASEQAFQANMFQAKQAQLYDDRNTYLANQAFQTFTGGRQSPQDDRYTIAFIITEIENMIAQENITFTNDRSDTYGEDDLVGIDLDDFEYD